MLVDDVWVELEVELPEAADWVEELAPADELPLEEPVAPELVEPEVVEPPSGSVYCWSPAEVARAAVGSAAASTIVTSRQTGSQRTLRTVASIASNEAAGVQ